ncbi:MAG: hypothetical protein CVV50_04190 [Spirochaetae bacterium HGW-Spirochaetae-6]|nr:MAG: hypothetical protein CVV50_04190 [Spirochaetae bacterium HGW-Spirochaetae-6]
MDYRFPGQDHAPKSKLDIKKIAYAVGAVLVVIFIYLIFKPAGEIASKTALSADTTMYNENLAQIAGVLKQQQQSLGSLSGVLKIVLILSGLSLLLNLVLAFKVFGSKKGKEQGAVKKEQASALLKDKNAKVSLEKETEKKAEELKTAEKK